MADIHKMEKDGKVIWPASSTTAIIDPNTKVILNKSIECWNIANLWSSELTSKDLQSAVKLLASKIPAESQKPGAKLEFTNAAGKNEAWEFVGGTGIAFTNLAGWRECGGFAISELMDQVFPLTTSLNVSPLVIPVGTGSQVSLSWSTTRNGVDVTSECSYMLNSISGTGTSKQETVTPLEYNTYTYSLQTTYRGITKQTDVKVVAIQPSYFGAIGGDTIPTSSNVAALSNKLQSDKKTTISGISYTAQRYVYAYPSVLGDLISIKDGNGFEYLGAGQGFTKMTLEINSVSYNVYYLTTKATVSNFEFTFA